MDIRRKDNIGGYIVSNSRLFKSKDVVARNEKEKNEIIEQLAEKCVPKQFATVVKRETRETAVQSDYQNKPKRRCYETLDASEMTPADPRPPLTLDDVIRNLRKQQEFANVGGTLTQDGANIIGGFTRQIIRKIILHSAKVATRENRKRLVPSDVDIATGIVQMDYDLTCPLLRATPSTDRMYWGRKFTKHKKTIDANSKDIVSNERFCEAIMIRDHWLVIEGVQPCIPENVEPSEVKEKYLKDLQDVQREHGFGHVGVKRGNFPEKRMSSQSVNLEHQVLYTQMTNILTTGSALQRQKVLECIETDTGIQFLAGRFVILIAEGIRLHIGTRNIRGLANLLKLIWSLMKNPTIRLEKYLYVLVPSLISCVVTKSMVSIIDSSKFSGIKGKAAVPPGASELTNDDKERITRDLDVEFRVREASGRMLYELSEQYQSQNLNVRVVQVLRRVLSGGHDPVSIYGVLCTFFAFGNLTIETVVLPKMHDIFCSLQSSRDSSGGPVKTTMTKMRKIMLESQSKRMEVVQNKTFELIMKIIYEHEIYNEKKFADRDAYMNVYSEFGALFYDYAFNNNMIDEQTGNLKSSRPSLLHHQKRFLAEAEKTKKKKVPHRNPIMTADETMLDDLFDDSHRPWTKPAAQCEELQKPVIQETQSTFFRTPKLFLIRKEKDPKGGYTASYIRPLEYGHMPSLPASKEKRRFDTQRESVLGQSIYASRASEVNKSACDSGELLKRFVNRPAEQAGAIIYGRNMAMSVEGQLSLDADIANAAARLSSVRLNNAVSTCRPTLQKDEVSRGRFLTRPQTLHNN